MSAAACAYCDKPATDRDHLTGRVGPGRSAYYDADLWVPSCRQCNWLNAKAWRSLGIAERFTLAGRLRRAAFGAWRLASGPGLWLPPASFWEATRRLLVAAADELEGLP